MGFTPIMTDAFRANLERCIATVEEYNYHNSLAKDYAKLIKLEDPWMIQTAKNYIKLEREQKAKEHQEARERNVVKVLAEEERTIYN